MQTNIQETTTLGGRYRLVRRIGVGGMGSVWEAEDRVLRRPVALKILAQPLCDDESVALRFRREAQAAGRLAHPNIAQVFDYGEDDGCPYIVLELVRGSTLRQALQERGRFDAREAARIGAQIASALVAAHAEGIVHRDVKPGNVILCPDGRVKVTDFGIAEAVWFEPITDTGTIMATAKYISPEQATGGGATAASDVYSAGVVIYELLAGRPPFEGDSPFAIAHAHAYELPEPLRTAAPGVPARIAGAVEAAMSKDPRERPSAAELERALGATPPEPTEPMVGGETTLVLPAVGIAVAAADAGTTTPLEAHGAPGVAAGTAGPPRPGRGAVWALVGMAVLAVLLAVALAASRGPDPGPSPSPRHAASPSAAIAGASPTPASPHDGKAAGHRGEHGGGKAKGHED